MRRVTEVSNARLVFLEELSKSDVVIGDQEDANRLAEFLRSLGLKDWKDFSVTYVRVPGIIPADRTAWKYGALFRRLRSISFEVVQRRGFNRTKIEVQNEDTFVSAYQKRA